LERVPHINNHDDIHLSFRRKIWTNENVD